METIVFKLNVDKYIEDDKTGEVEVCKAEKVQDNCSCIVRIVVLGAMLHGWTVLSEVPVVTRHDTGAGVAYIL